MRLLPALPEIVPESNWSAVVPTVNVLPLAMLMLAA